ncbi:unnamed protein product [Moneuplotes crassus]|uniref:V-type proton ATPase subunit a n=1 Tax=Euplotes crassus TaxID=5936 RepID=A0AAD1Y4P2_EUPCR|nr:unnamed protein product [Moneuplotes crassus]
MSLLRSESMHLYQFTCFKDNAPKAMLKFGALDCIQFIDLNKREQSFNLVYGKEIKRCEETLRNLQILIQESSAWKIPMTTPKTIQELEKALTKIQAKPGQTNSAIFDDIEEEIRKCREWKEETMKSYYETKKDLVSLVLMREVYKMGREKYRLAARIGEVRGDGNSSKDMLKEPLLDQNVSGYYAAISIANIAGVVGKEDSIRLRRLVFRATRGKAIVITQDVSAEILREEGILAPKTMYLIIFQKGDFIHQRLTTICESFNSEKYDLPEPEESQNIISELTSNISKIREVIITMNAEIKEFFWSINQIPNSSLSRFMIYQSFIRRELAIHNTLNKLVPINSLIHGFFWSPLPNRKIQENIQLIQSEHRFPGLQALELMEEDVSNGHKLIPPTKIRSNDFIEPFQQIVNTYGVPGYKEVNPAYFTIITFPFLFGVMFGDIGHGLLLFLFSAYLCLRNDHISSDSFLSYFLPARYLLLLMGFFSTFCGLCYNDMMSIPLGLFGDSCYSKIYEVTIQECVYPIGIDPTWYTSSFSITFINSMKMKLSVIIAVAHMALGICMKALNAIHFKSKLDFYFEFLPQIVLLLALFGYMDLLIILKWLSNYSGEEHMAPSIINTMINIPLKGAMIEGYPFIDSIEKNQQISLTLLLIAIICIPLMLIPKPFILINALQHDKDQTDIISFQDPNREGQEESYHRLYDEDETQGNPIGDTRQGNEEEKRMREESPKNESNFSRDSEIDKLMKKISLISEDNSPSHTASEIFIHQLIETIEFVLGTISNTASYLRLWALSLAHSQLAEVFFELVLWSGVKAQNPIMIFIGFMVFATASFAVLMCMDLMECFLHTLRLHWVEFQNKFYKGNGTLFAPLNFRSCITEIAQLN